MNACPRCGGRLFLNPDRDRACLNCGYVQYGTAPLPFDPHPDYAGNTAAFNRRRAKPLWGTETRQ